jgi:hypothetical protein
MGNALSRFSQDRHWPKVYGPAMGPTANLALRLGDTENNISISRQTEEFILLEISRIRPFGFALIP